jgi:hypothetical protein
MLAMLDKVEGSGWVGYQSSENAEISYATVQGREALVQKFRSMALRPCPTMQSVEGEMTVGDTVYRIGTRASSRIYTLPRDPSEEPATRDDRRSAGPAASTSGSVATAGLARRMVQMVLEGKQYPKMKMHWPSDPRLTTTERRPRSGATWPDA